MNIMERKAEFIKTVLNDVDAETLDKLESYLKSVKRFPCQFTKEELILRAKKAEEEVASNIGLLSHEDVMKDYTQL